MSHIKVSYVTIMIMFCDKILNSSTIKIIIIFFFFLLYIITIRIGIIVDYNIILTLLLTDTN